MKQNSKAFIKPKNEDARIEALRALNVLDTPPEKLFDDLVLLASEVSESPISALSLIDVDRQWFKAIVGLNETETPRDIAFCTHTILNKRGQAFIVNDASTDERFAQNPLVTGEMRIRYYAGFPIILFGEYAVGSLCVVDQQYKALSQFQLATLAKLAEIAVQRLEALAPEFRSVALQAYFR